jgi:hypothetical protein
MSKSNRFDSHQNLTAKFTPRRAEALLQFWANLADTDADEFDSELECLTKYAPEIFDSLTRPLESADSHGAEENHEDFRRSISGLREHLRAVWQATDLRVREWYIYELRRLYTQHTRAFSAPALIQAIRSAADRLLGPISQDVPAVIDFQQIGAELRKRSEFWGYWVDPPPALTGFERTMFHLQRIAHRARKCENPECTAPYFFLKRKGQKYCSEECALPAQRRAKSEWWARNREDQIKKRRQQREAVKTERLGTKDTRQPFSGAKARKIVRQRKKREIE